MDQKSQENLEAKLKEVRESDEFVKLTPEEQKQKLQQIKDQGRQTFGDFSKTEKYNNAPEKNLQDQELKKLEHSLGTSPEDKSTKNEKPTANLEELDQSNQKFLQLLEAAHQNIIKQTPIHFPTISLDSAGRSTPALARMTRLTDYNNSTQDFQKIKERFVDKNDPKKLAEVINQPLVLRLDIQMGDNSSQEYLQDLSMEVSLQGIHDQLQKGHRLTEILSAFTNLVLSAAAEHSQKNSSTQPETSAKQNSPSSNPAFKKVSKNNTGDLNSMSGAFSQDSLSAVTFNSTSGQIWGEMDLNQIVATHQAPAESTDQLSPEK